MTVRIQKQKTKAEREQAVEETSPTSAKADHADTDALLDSIDEILDDMLTDQTAQEFVTSFQQKGGQ